MTRKELKQSAKNALGNSWFSSQWLLAFVILLIASLLEGFACAFVVGAILVGGPFMVGLAKTFVGALRGNKFTIAGTFSGFDEKFGRNIGLGFMQSIFIALWSLLLVVPGIIKAFAYSMSGYIAADHPELTWNECITESRKMMKGHKWQLFVLGLSFIPWFLLVGVTCGICAIWVVPYVETTIAAFYESIK